MPEPEEQAPVRRRSSFGLLISFLFVISLIVGVIILLNRNTATTLNEQSFVSALENDRIVTVYETPKEETIVRITGSYYKNAEAKTKNVKSDYVVIFDYSHFNDAYDWYYCYYCIPEASLTCV